MLIGSCIRISRKSLFSQKIVNVVEINNFVENRNILISGKITEGEVIVNWEIEKIL